MYRPIDMKMSEREWSGLIEDEVHSRNSAPTQESTNLDAERPKVLS